jgi:hypothetical protein
MWSSNSLIHKFYFELVLHFVDYFVFLRVNQSQQAYSTTWTVMKVQLWLTTQKKSHRVDTSVLSLDVQKLNLDFRCCIFLLFLQIDRIYANNGLKTVQIAHLYRFPIRH